MTSWEGLPDPGTRPLALVLSGGVLLVAIGAAFVASAASNPFFGLLGPALVLLGVAGAGTAVLERRWDARRPGPRLSRDPTGAPSTLVACAPWTGASRWAVSLALVVPLVVVALVALLGTHWVVAVIVGLPAVLLARSLAPWVTPQGVHLSARGVTVRHHGRPQQVDWDDMTGLDITTWMVIFTADGRSVRFTARQLAVGFDHLAVGLSRFAQDPALRSALGTPTSLDPRLWGLDA